MAVGAGIEIGVKVVFYYCPGSAPDSELEGIAEMASFEGYNVHVFCFNLKDLQEHVELVKPHFVMVWNYKNIELNTDFKHLMSKMQQPFYCFQNFEAYYPRGLTGFKKVDFWERTYKSI